MKTILRFAIALVLILSAFGLKAQDGSEYLLWEKTKDFTTRDIAFSPDETHIAVSAEYTDTYPHTYSIKILSVQTGEELYSIPIPKVAWPIFYTSDGKYLVAQISEDQNIIFDAKSYVILKKIHAGAISFSADNKLFSTTGYEFKFEIYNAETLEKIYEKDLIAPGKEEKGFFEVFFTPNGKYLISDVTIYTEGHYDARKIHQEIYDAKTFQKIDLTINCLKNYSFLNNSVFSNTGLLGNTFPKEGSNSSKPIGFRIYDYEKDSLIWEQETENYSGLIFLNTKNYLISRFGLYMDGNPDMRVFKTWDLINRVPSKDMHCIPADFEKLSKSDKYFFRTNRVSLWLYDFEKMFEANVSVTEQTTTPSNIEIISNSENNTIAINFLENTNEQTNITLYNLSGNLVDVIYSGIPSGKIEYSTAHLAKGVYLVKVESKTNTFTNKVIINY